MALDTYIALGSSFVLFLYALFRLWRYLNLGLILESFILSAMLGFTLGWYTYPLVVALQHPIVFYARLAVVSHQALIAAIYIGLVSFTLCAGYTFFAWLRYRTK